MASGEKVEMKWIDVKQELPQEDIDVLAYLEDGAQCRALVNDGEWFEHATTGDYEMVNFEVTHWMPLPDPPTNSKGGESQ